MAAKNIGFGGGHSGVGACCSSGDDGVAGATGLPSAGGTGGGPVVTYGRGLDWRVRSTATVSPLSEVLPFFTVVTDGSVMAVSVGEGNDFPDKKGSWSEARLHRS
jgi:hypothetical protein